MKLVLDTSSLSKVLSQNIDAIRRLSNISFDELIIPLAVDAELRYGFLYGNRHQENLLNYADLKQRYKIMVVAPTQATSVQHAELAVWARRNGFAIGKNDLWIAATTIELAGRLLTYDADFERLPQLQLA